jgi:hypothetical protein
MTLSPEQFNQLATKKDLNDYASRDDLQVFKNEILEAIDVVIKKLNNIEHDYIANQAAHDRFENRITQAEKSIKLILKPSI